MTLTEAERLALIQSVRIAAQDHILPRFRALDAADIAMKSSRYDLVTAADLAAETALTEAAGKILPGALVVGEEATAQDSGLPARLAAAETAVIVDPVDGTWNFAHGISTFGVILSVMRAGRIVFGLHYDPLNDDWVEATAGQGAWLQRGGRHRLRLADDGTAPPASDLFGMIPVWLFPPATRERAIAAQAGFGRIGALRCSCHEYRLLVQGGTDFLLSVTANAWDHAAGVLLTQEAGGVARMLDGSAYVPGQSRGCVLAARSEAVLRRVQEAWPLSPADALAPD